MKIIDTDIADVKILEPKVFGDDRGFFMETWRDDAFKQQVANVDFVQDNHSKSAQGVLRGLHYQLRQPQGKLVRVIAGSGFDVAVDIRKGSPSFGRWVGVELSAENKRLIWIPAGFAHGFYTLSDNVELLYRCTDYYHPESERTILWDDPDIGISWPLPDGQPPMLSEKDRNGHHLKIAEVYP